MLRAVMRVARLVGFLRRLRTVVRLRLRLGLATGLRRRRLTEVLRRLVVVFRRLLRRGLTSNISLITFYLLTVINARFLKTIFPADNIEVASVKTCN